MTPLPSDFTLQSALAVSDVVISAVPNKNYKVKTEWLKDGCICVNVAGDKNFEADVRDKVSDDRLYRAICDFLSWRLIFEVCLLRYTRPRSTYPRWDR